MPNSYIILIIIYMRRQALAFTLISIQKFTRFIKYKLEKKLKANQMKINILYNK